MRPLGVMNNERGANDDAPGWAAIDEALRPIYGAREPYHVGTIVPYALGGPDPIHGISAYKNLEPAPHWHFVTYGLSELWAKGSSDREISGFGFELTFRPLCDKEDTKPPNWHSTSSKILGGTFSRPAVGSASATRFH